jgi:hypothetical protein
LSAAKNAFCAKVLARLPSACPQACPRRLGIAAFGDALEGAWTLACSPAAGRIERRFAGAGADSAVMLKI